MVKPNQDIRDYMADHCVSQRQLAEATGTSVWTINTKLKVELSQNEKEQYLNMIDAIARERLSEEDIPAEEPETFLDEEEDCTEEESDQKFQIGDRVKYPAPKLRIGIIADIWESFSSGTRMYTVRDEEDGHCAMYAEAQLEPAPLPIDYSFESHIDGNVAVVTMIATQGEKSWVYARGHAHILHDGEVGMAQAISYAARRMFETLDKKQENKIYFK